MKIKDRSKCNVTIPFWNDNPHFDSLAEQEGWGLFDATCSQHGRWQVQEWADTVTIVDDSRAWTKVINGTKSHHKSAVAFIRYFNPNEYNRMLKFKN